MKKLLVVVDMQNDFITGTLANVEGQKIVDGIADLIKEFDGDIIATRDTHFDNYLDTQEGKRLPVPHCIQGTDGWQIVPQIRDALDQKGRTIYMDKRTFGSTELGDFIVGRFYDEATLVGVCTDICVISNALMIKASAPETRVMIRRDLCAGVTPQSHEIALKAMAACQSQIV